MDLQTRIPHLLPQLVDYNGLPYHCNAKITITCKCGKESSIGVRNLVRRWEKEAEYRCKSCDISTYANSPERVSRFRQTFAKIANTPEHRAKCSQSGSQAMASPEAREKASQLLTLRNKTDIRVIDGRKKALAVFMATIGQKHLAKMRANQAGRESILEKTTAAILDKFGMQYQRQYELGYYRYDFYVPSVNLLLEIQGEYWHKDTVAKDSAKATYATTLGYQVKHIWEHEFGEIGKIESILKNLVNPSPVQQIEFEFSDCQIKEIDTYQARVFYGQYHYLPSTKKFGYHLGCFHNNRLIAATTFSAITRKEIADRLKLSSMQIKEVGRFCIADEYHKRNFGSWFLSKATSIFRSQLRFTGVTHLISFADTTIHVGTIYKACNWIDDGLTDPNYSYRSADGFLCHKRAIWDRSKKMGMAENEYALLHGYIKVWSEPKRRFILQLSR